MFYTEFEAYKKNDPREFGVSHEKVWPWAGILCCDKVFLCRDRVSSRSRVFYVATKYFYVVTEFAKMKRNYVATEYFFVAIEFGLEWGFYVATECFYIATEFGLDNKF